MCQTRRPQRFLVQLIDLILIELTNFRWTWRSTLLLGIVTPMSSMIAIKLLLAQATSADLAYIYCGNVLLSLMFENQNRVADHFVFMRFHGTLDYFGSLPVKPVTLILALSLSFFVLSLPSLVVIICAGAMILDVHLRLQPLLIIVIPLCAICLAGVGALVGALARTSAEATSIGYFVTLVLSGLGAVIIPPQRLPSWLVRLGALNPATYASSALRHTMIKNDESLGPGLVVMFLCALATLAYVAHRLGQRRD